MTREKDKGIMEKVDKSKNSIGLLQAHLERGTCPKSLRYNVRTNIMPDEDFKSDISSIKKRAEHDFVGALVKFHHRRVEKLINNKTQKTRTS